MLRIKAVQPLGKASDDPQASCPGGPVGVAERRLPAQEERGAEVRGAFLVRKGEKSTQDPFVRAEVIAEAAPDGQIALQLL